MNMKTQPTLTLLVALILALGRATPAGGRDLAQVGGGAAVLAAEGQPLQQARQQQAAGHQARSVFP